MEREGTHHNALDDATSQARHLTKILDSLAPVKLAAAIGTAPSEATA